MRELAQDADPERRLEIQAQWRQLTQRPEDRIRSAFFAHPHPQEDRGAVSPTHLSGRILDAPCVEPTPPLALSISDLVVFPSLGVSLGELDVEWSDVSAADDPLLDL